MKQFIYIDDTDDVIELPKRARKVRIGQTIQIDGEDYEAWYSEDVGTTHRNIRVERKA